MRMAHLRRLSDAYPSKLAIREGIPVIYGPKGNLLLDSVTAENRHCDWLGRQASNLRMPAPKPVPYYLATPQQPVGHADRPSNQDLISCSSCPPTAERRK